MIPPPIAPPARVSRAYSGYNQANFADRPTTEPSAAPPGGQYRMTIPKAQEMERSRIAQESAAARLQMDQEAIDRKRADKIERAKRFREKSQSRKRDSGDMERVRQRTPDSAAAQEERAKRSRFMAQQG